MLRAEAGRDLYDRRLTDLIVELPTRSEEFRRRWAAHNVRMHTTGVKLLQHPVVGDERWCNGSAWCADNRARRLGESFIDSG